MPEYSSPGVYVEEIPSAIQAIAGVGTSCAGFIGVVPDRATFVRPNPDYDPTRQKQTAAPDAAGGGKPVPGKEAVTAEVKPREVPSNADANPYLEKEFDIATPALEAKLCTSFAEFRRYFGPKDAPAEFYPFGKESANSILAHAVLGFFNNGGRRCYVIRIKAVAGVADALEKFEPIDEIAIVAAPGITDTAAQDAIVTHCDRMNDRLAIFDSEEEVSAVDNSKIKRPGRSKNAAFYFPWIEVSDPVTKLNKDGGRRYVPPSGHVAGIYARVDAERGVHKAPANEVVRGALGVRYTISKAQQDGLNPVGINCIRDMNGNLRVWGARLSGGDSLGEWKYVNVRRLFLFLCESIDEGTQWVVFEPNDSRLWAKITRNVTAFLTNVWRDGALFGDTPQQAFYVKCDSTTNPASERELGKVIIEVGVAIVRPAEFVIFRISQWSGPEST
jgi:phage tail sheath protein FI